MATTYILTSTFDPDQAQAAVSDLLTLGDAAERLAEKLNWPQDIDLIAEGYKASSFRQLVQDVTRIKSYLNIEHQIAEVQSERWAFRFMGASYREMQLNKLSEEKKQIGSLIDAPLWFYKQPRVVLLSALRDYGLDMSYQGDAQWIDSKSRSLYYPIAEMFESGDVSMAKIIASELEKPFRNINPRFVLEKFEGHRSISFDFNTNIAVFYTPTRGA